MLRGVFRTKEGKIITALLVMAVIILSIFAFNGYSQKKRFVEQAVMAENYLKAGSYEQAVEAYSKALSMKSNDEQLLTIGLAKAYSGMKDYDKALEALRACYTKTSGVKIKEEIEAITSEKTDYEYLQSISHAEVYFSNKDYEKAIAEYEKAKLIKSKEATAYQKIAEAYIEMGQYELAKEEILVGQTFTQDESLSVTAEVVDSYLKKEQYDTLISQASEYILQENYEDGIAQYEEAISLLPKESAAYLALAKIYILNKEYEKAVLLLQEAIGLVSNIEVTELFNQASQLKALEDEINHLMTVLYQAFEKRDFTTITAIMDMALFKENVAKELPVYYNDGMGDIEDGFGMIKDEDYTLN